MIFKISTVAGLSEVSKFLISQMDQVKIFLLKGDLGAGKTTLVKQWMKDLHVQDNVTSPTFSLINEYRSNELVIYHMDMYRIKNSAEAHDIGIEEYIYDSGHYNLIEWPEIIMDLIEPPYIIINITAEQDDRIIRIEHIH